MTSSPPAAPPPPRRAWCAISAPPSPGSEWSSNCRSSRDGKNWTCRSMPSSDTNYDLIVIGSGPAGEKGAAQAAYFGKRVAIIEREPVLGGASVNTGTIPSKTLRESALHLSGFRQRGFSDAFDVKMKSITVRDFMYRKELVVAHEWKRIEEN